MSLGEAKKESTFGFWRTEFSADTVVFHVSFILFRGRLLCEPFAVNDNRTPFPEPTDIRCSTANLAEMSAYPSCHHLSNKQD